MKTNTDLIKNNTVFSYLAALTAFILSIPLVAMQFTTEVDWSTTDFVIMGALIFGMGTLFIVVARATSSKYRAFTAVAFLITFLLIWAHLAVGIVDTWPLAGS